MNRKLTRSYIRKLIKEEFEGLENDPLSVNDLQDLEDRDDAWAGGDNLHVNIDHPKAAGSEETVTTQEVLPIIMDEHSLRRLVMDVLLEIDD
jgi:hypothetical protein